VSGIDKFLNNVVATFRNTYVNLVSTLHMSKLAEIQKASPGCMTFSSVITECDCIIFSMPAPAYSEYLKAVCTHARAGTVLLGLPGVGCFEWAVADACSKIGRPMSDFKVVFTQDVPLSCRIDEMGKKVFIRGKKVNGTMLGCVPPGDELVFCAWVEEMLLGQVNVRPAPALQCTLGTGCMVSHGFTLEACLKELDETGRDLEEGELLWYGREERNTGMDDADCEWRGLATAGLEEYSDDTTPPPVWELVSFLEMWQQWYPEVKHYDTLAKSVANLSAYRWTTVPAQTVQVGDAARRVPNMTDRKFTQDIPFSVCLVSLLGEHMNIPTPTFDRNVQYMQSKMGKEYIIFTPAGKKVGSDLQREAHYMPFLTGEIGLQRFLDFYCFQEKPGAPCACIEQKSDADNSSFV